MLRRLALGLALSGLTLFAAPAQAATAQANLNVRANVRGHCTIVAQPFDFGDYTPSVGTDLDLNGGVSVTCTTNTTFWLGLDTGINANAGARRMQRGASGEYLDYELYTDAPGGAVWTNANGPVAVANTPGFVAYPIPIFGRIPAGQVVTAGVYNDTVTMTLNF